MKKLLIALILLMLCCMTCAAADITLPENLTRIDDYAFFDDTALTGHLTIPEGVTYIGEQAFAHCTGLTGVTLPSSVTFIGPRAFWGCEELMGLVVNNGMDIADDAFEGCPGIVVAEVNPVSDFSYIVVDDEVAITGYVGLSENVVIPGEIEGLPVTVIGVQAFYQSPVKHVVVPENVRTIAKEAFCRSSAVTVTLPQSLLTIEEYALNSCSNLLHINLPDSIISVGAEALSFCTNLRQIHIPNKLTVIEEGAFSGLSSVKEIVLPDSLLEIRRNGLSHNYSLTTLTLPNSLTKIGEFAFCWCFKLESIVIPDSVLSMEGAVFYYCTSLKTVVLSNNITEINNGTFDLCYNLTSVTCPVNLKKTEQYGGGFQDNLRITTLAFPDGMEFISLMTDMPNLRSIYIPDSVTHIEESFILWDNSPTFINMPALECIYVQSLDSYAANLFRKELPQVKIVQCASSPTPGILASSDLPTFADNFRQPSYVENPSLVKASAELATLVFEESYEGSAYDIPMHYCFSNLAGLGFLSDTIKSCNITSGQHTTGVVFAMQYVDDVPLFAIIIRGTTGAVEWVSNFTVGDGDVHEGFSKAKHDVYMDFLQYQSELADMGYDVYGDCKIWITGHSRGAAVGNLLASTNFSSNKDNTYVYLFATPNVSKDTSMLYPNVHNYIAHADIVPRVPPIAWSYGKVGITKTIIDSRFGSIPEDEMQKFMKFATTFIRDEHIYVEYLQKTIVEDLRNKPDLDVEKAVVYFIALLLDQVNSIPDLVESIRALKTADEVFEYFEIEYQPSEFIKCFDPAHAMDNYYTWVMEHY